MAIPKDVRPVLPVPVGASIMLSLGMGVRQSFSLVMSPLTRDIALAVSDFALASCDLAWRLGVAMGLTAGIAQVTFALRRPPPASPRPIPA